MIVGRLLWWLVRHAPWLWTLRNRPVKVLLQQKGDRLELYVHGWLSDAVVHESEAALNAKLGRIFEHMEARGLNVTRLERE